MTTVNVTTTNNTVTVTEDGSSTVVQNPVTTTVTATTAGPQGPAGPAGQAGSNFTLDQTAKVDKSVIYYDSASGEYKADATWTINTIVLGGNF
jgi:hypothetical protein|tara:strand:- start:7 stop:285 length:279 start_codon:yes stop_codon:yes gene_type:complete